MNYHRVWKLLNYNKISSINSKKILVNICVFIINITLAKDFGYKHDFN